MSPAGEDDFIESVGFCAQAASRNWNATIMKTLIAALYIAGLLPLAFAQDATSKPINPSDAKAHIGETATVCGKVVDTKVSKYGIAGHGKPVTLDLDQPEPNPVFYFVAFGEKPDGPQEVVNAYYGKQVCVTGKVDSLPSGGAPFIMAKDRSQQVKLQGDAK
jgi:hypothetical protein